MLKQIKETYPNIVGINPHILFLQFLIILSKNTPFGSKSNKYMIRELIFQGCPANHYGTPCKPCPFSCNQCNAVDGSCLCENGYTGENCSEGKFN